MADGYIDIYVDSQTGKEYTEDTLPPELRARAMGARPVTGEGFYGMSEDIANSLKTAGYGLVSNFANIGDLVGRGMQLAPSLGYALSNVAQPMSSTANPSYEQSDFFSTLASGIENLGADLSNKSIRLRDEYGQKAQQAQESIVQDPDDSFYNFAINALPTASKAFGATLPAIATKNPALISPAMTGLFVGEGFGADYGQGREAGLDTFDSTLLAAERAIPNYIQSKAIDPITPAGGLKGILGQSANIAGSTALDLANRYVTDKMILEGGTPTLGEAYDYVTENMTNAAPDMLGAMAGARTGSTFARGRQARANQTLAQELEGNMTPIDKPLGGSLEGELTPIEEPLADPKPVEVKEKIDLTEQTKGAAPAIDTMKVEDAQTVVKKESDVLQETRVMAELDDGLAEVISLVDEVESPTPVPDQIETQAEKNVNAKIDEIAKFEAKVEKTSEVLRPLVERKLVDPDKAVAVSEAIPESVLGGEAKQLQLDFIQRAPVEGLTPDNIKVLANETSNLSRVTSQLELQSQPVDLLNKLEAYRKELDTFESKIGDKSPFKSGIDVNRYKKSIIDEVAQSLDPYNDPDFFRALDQIENDPKAIRKLIKDRLVAKDKGLVTSYKDNDAPSFIETIKNEKGAINPDLFGFNKLKGATEKIKQNVYKATDADELQNMMLDEIHKRVLDEVGEIIPGKNVEKTRYDIDRFLQGEIKTFEEIPGFDKIPSEVKQIYEKPLSYIRKWYTQPKRIADLDVEGGNLKKFYKGVHKKKT